MPNLEAGLRGAGIALLLLLAIILLRDGRRAVAVRLGALYATCAAATLISAAPPLDGQAYLWLLPFQILNVGSPVLFWLLASALFDDEFEPGWPHALAWLGLTGVGLWMLRIGGHPAFWTYKAATLACVGAALLQVLAGRAGDLVEARRRLRVRFVAVIAAFTAVLVISSLFLHGGRDTPAFGYSDAIGNLVIAAVLAVVVLSLGPSPLLEPLALATGRRDEPLEPDPREAGLLEALRGRMQDDRAYREEDLNIAALAARLSVPEYRLRRLINQRLGHRNFAAFLNGYRLDDATAALADPSQDAVPILTIALDSGFASIGVFNRAFKARTGMTPTEFRRARGG
jgi:AraC-like DNA-binding protein